MSRVAGQIVMIARSATKVVVVTTMPKSATTRARNLAETLMGTGFAGGLLRCASCEGEQPFATSHALHAIPQNRVRGHAGLVQCFLSQSTRLSKGCSLVSGYKLSENASQATGYVEA